MYFQDDELCVGSCSFPHVTQSGFCLWFPPPEGAAVTLGIHSPALSDMFCFVFLLSFSSVSLQRKSPQGKGKRRPVHMMKSAAAPRLPRSLLSRPQTHKQVRAEGEVECVCSFFAPPWTLTVVRAEQPDWNYDKQYADTTGLYSGLDPVTGLTLVAEVSISESVVFFLWTFFSWGRGPNRSAHILWQNKLYFPFPAFSLHFDIPSCFSHCGKNTRTSSSMIFVDIT